MPEVRHGFYKEELIKWADKATPLRLLRQGTAGGCWIVFLPAFILYIFLSEKILAGVTGGGVKG